MANLISMTDVHSLEVVGRGRETQLEMGKLYFLFFFSLCVSSKISNSQPFLGLVDRPLMIIMWIASVSEATNKRIGLTILALRVRVLILSETINPLTAGAAYIRVFIFY